MNCGFDSRALLTVSSRRYANVVSTVERSARASTPALRFVTANPPLARNTTVSVTAISDQPRNAVHRSPIDE